MGRTSERNPSGKRFDKRQKSKARRLYEWDGISQESIAEIIGCSRKSIENWMDADAEAGDPWVKGRFSQELREREAAAKVKAIEAHGWNQGRVMAELGVIAGSRITDFVSWGNRMVVLKPSAAIDKDKIGAIAEISRSKNGDLKFKLHNKLDALRSIGQELGMFKTEAQQAMEAGIFAYYREQAAKRRGGA